MLAVFSRGKFAPFFETFAIAQNLSVLFSSMSRGMKLVFLYYMKRPSI